MNLVEKHRKLSTVKELCDKFAFTVEPFPGKQGSYCIQYMYDKRYDQRRAYLDKEFVSYVMRKALQTKTDHQDRLVFKVSYDTIYYDLNQVVVFDSYEKAKKALFNFMYFIHRRHGSLAFSIMVQAKNQYAPF
ncbi:hypothetical protein [Heyndrickxia sporothermodurans]|uniref:hypothetical protein n=1 Tax=Heyndrickxia sporothermodurans TaxID=46224 RepID=UPI001057253F|nr:hypothetical protein [Heyndrickxia sporothermodurans]